MFLASSFAACKAPGQSASLSVNTDSIATAPDSVADRLLVDLSTLSNPAAIDARYATPNNFTGAPLPGYEANRAFLRREAAAAFERASFDLAARGYRLHVFDAYRPVRATEAMVAWTRRVSRTDLLRDGYIAERSRHNLGLAVDCTIEIVQTGVDLDMGTGFDTFSPAAHTRSATGMRLSNRLVLRAAMERAGFVPYDDEWWHFAYPADSLAASPMRFDRVIRAR